ncbi:ester cyclase [Nocardia sp. CDC153]|uniref:ester cyclase n=1 Tax=Nocardia sp. CDC153 TaxID=3112167 RepID=UPI002DB94D55|nr:ester cyclase [Nocardia sp. CDC153]MEC3956295.1 ester cyclase [Nocardia sp. CDC153]
MSVDPKTVVRTFYSTTDAISAGTLQGSALDEVLAETLVVHMPDGTHVDRDGFKAVNHAFAQGFPGSVHTLEDIIAEGDRVVARMRWRGTHSGEFQSAPPTGNTIELAETGIMRVEDGKIVEFWPLFDSLALMLGVGIAKI